LKRNYHQPVVVDGDKASENIYGSSDDRHHREQSTATDIIEIMVTPMTDIIMSAVDPMTDIIEIMVTPMTPS
jgi:hypothetical protein